MKYVKVDWPEIQDYMGRPDYNENCYFDPRNNCWFIPEVWEEDDWRVLQEEIDEEWGGDIGDLDDAIG